LHRPFCWAPVNLWGKYKERQKFGRRLEEYDFYLTTVNRDNFPEFSLNNFRLGMHYFLRNNDRPPRDSSSSSANRTTSAPSSSRRAKGLRAPCSTDTTAKKIADDTSEYLENFTRITRSSANHFRISGSRSCSTICRTRRTRSSCSRTTSPAGTCATETTTFVIDLKKRQIAHEDKLNYELNIGARKFSAPVEIMKENGVVGAVSSHQSDSLT